MATGLHSEKRLPLQHRCPEIDRGCPLVKEIGIICVLNNVNNIFIQIMKINNYFEYVI